MTTVMMRLLKSSAMKIQPESRKMETIYEHQTRKSY